MTRCILPPTAPEHVCDIRRRTVLVASPAPGVDWSQLVPVAEAWSVRGLFAQLTTSAAVANRAPQLRILEPNVPVLTLQPSGSIAASSVGRFSVVPGGPAAANATGGAFSWGAPDPFVVPPGYTLAVVTPTLDVADQWSAIALDVIFELNRGRGAARRYANWVRQQAAGLPDTRVASGPGDAARYP